MEIEQEDAQRGKYLTFFLGSEVYGIEILYVTEIIGIQKITPIPDLAEYVRGVINLRGSVVPVMDVRLRFQMEAREYDERTCIVVICSGETNVGLIVDTVSEVLEIPDEQIEETGALDRDHGNRYIKGIGKDGDDVKILLNVEALLSNESGSMNLASGKHEQGERAVQGGART